jgi:hypothetical protein
VRKERNVTTEKGGAYRIIETDEGCVVDEPTWFPTKRTIIAETETLDEAYKAIKADRGATKIKSR